MEHYHCMDIEHVARVANRVTIPAGEDRTVPFSIRRALFAHRTPLNDHCPVILSAEADYNYAGYWITYPKLYEAEAKELMAGLPMYMVQFYGKGEAILEKAILRLFTLVGQERYDNMEWDKETERVITDTDKEFEDTIAGYNTPCMEWMGGGTLDDFMKRQDQALSRPPPQLIGCRIFTTWHRSRRREPTGR